MGWAFRERATGNQVQQQAEAIKVALLKAVEQGRWRIIKVDVPGKQLLEQIQGKKNMDKYFYLRAEYLVLQMLLFFQMV